MAVYDFTGANGDPLPSGLINLYGTSEIQSNKLTFTGSEPAPIDWIVYAGDSDPKLPVSVTIKDVDGSSQQNNGVCHHYNTDDDSFVFFGIKPSDGLCRLYKRSGGSFSLIDSYSFSSYIQDDPTKLTIRPVEGSAAGVYDAYECLINDNIVIPATTITDAGIDTTVTGSAIRAGANTTFVDDFSYSDASVVEPPADTTPPIIQLNGYNRLNIFVGDNYIDAGATATDNIDGDITSDIVVTGTVDNSQKSTNFLYYDVTDSAGNAATQLRRTVKTLSRLDVATPNDFDVKGVRSWWMSDLDTVHNGKVISGFINENGDQGIAQFNAETLELEQSRVLQNAVYPEDDHSAIPHLFTSSGRLIALWTGHGQDRSFQNNGEYWCSESSGGDIIDLSDPVRFEFGVARSNYVQIFENSQGDVIAISNEDVGAKWFPMLRIGVNQWEDGKPIIDLGNYSGGGSNQYYVKAAMIGDTLRMVRNSSRFEP